MSRQNRFDWFASRSSRRKAKTLKLRRSQSQRKLRYETLEDRRLLAITVDTLIDEADGLGVGTGTSLRDAIAVATFGETIDFAPALSGGAINLTLGELAISKSITISGPGAGILTIDASANDPTPTLNNSDGIRIFRILPGVEASPEVSISGLTLRGGDSDNFGGAIYSSTPSSSSLTLSNLIVTDNHAPLNGGGVYVADGTLDVNGSTFSSNTAGMFGGGIDIPVGVLNLADSTILGNSAGVSGGGLSTSADTSIDDSLFTQNTAAIDGGGVNATDDLSVSGTELSANFAGRDGGGISWNGHSFLTVFESHIASNTGQRSGGGIYANNAGGNALIWRTTLTDNAAQGTNAAAGTGNAEGGGGINVRTSNGGDTRILNSSISDNNRAPNSLGGGILSTIPAGTNDNRIDIEGSLIANNLALAGAGVTIINNSGNVSFISNSTVTGNSTSGEGGGLLSFNFGAANFVEHSTIVGNQGGIGGGVAWWNGFVIDHTIIANNSIPSGPRDLAPLTGTSTEVFLSRYSLIGTNDVGGFTQVIAEAPLGSPDSSGNLVGGPVNGIIDPKLEALAENGGLTRTHAVTPNSPLLNAGDPGAFFVPLYDQRGFPFRRIALERIDIGAYELAADPASTLVVDSIVDELDTDWSPGDLSLREAIWLANLDSDTQTIQFDPALTSNGSATITLTHGELLISESLTIEGPGPGVLIIDASGNDPTPTQNNGDGSRIFNIGNPAANNTITISGLTLTGGDSNADGGAIFSVDDLSLIDLVTIDNSAQIRGGGVYVNGEATIVDSRIADNVAALEGGGVYMAAGSLLVDRSIVEDNQASAGKGGGLATTNTDLVITTSSIFGNTAATNGGGIDNFAGSLTVRDSTIALNVSNGGGGISTSNIAIIGNSTISGNFGGTGGAGGLNAAGATITNSTLIKNTADAPGGGILGNVTLINTIVADNTDTTGQADDISGSTSATHSLIGDNTGSGLATTPDGTPDANGNLLGPAFFESALTVSVQMAAMGEFDLGEDDYLFEYSIDDGPFLPLFTSLVDQGASQDYFLDSGTQVTLADPLLVNGTLLNDDFRTLTATIPNAGNEINIRFTATSNGGSEAFAWRNLLVRDNNFNTIGRAASFDQANDLFTAFVPIDPINVNPYDAVPGDMFGIRSRSNPGSTGLPFAIADDSLSIFPADTQGIVGENDSGRFFGVVDTINGVGNDTNSALWVFNFGGVAIDPLLGPLADNGGGTLTHNLLPGSVAIDAGDPALATPPVFDQRGNVFNRIVDGNGNSTPQIDIGAVELQTIDTLPFTLLVDTPTDTYDGDFSPGEVSLREALSFANLVPGADTIDFDPALAGGTISLLRGQLNVTDSLTINGLGADQLTIDATSNDPSPNVNNGDGSRVFSVNGLGTLNVDINGLTITGADVSGNGGGIFSRENLDLTEVSVSGNVASGDGGGIYQSGGSLTVSNSTLDGNTAQDWGGAVRNSGGVLSVFNSAITHNSAHLGGGIYSRSFVGTALIDSSTLSGNTATGHGGGVDSADGDLFIRHSTITANTAPAGEGSGISSHDGTTEIYSSIVAGNTNSDVDDVNIGDSTFTSGGYNLIGTGNATINFTNNDLTGVDDPLLGPLGDNGGPTFTHALLPGSPAIDESDPTFTSLPIGDQRGDTFARVADGDLDTAARLDIGAYELQPPSAGLSADFDGDTDVDGADFLSWQRGFGTTNGAAKGDGDANGDGAVNGSDLAVWNGTYGQTGGQTFDFTDQLIAYWPFDSGGSDASGNGLDVNLVGSATTAATGVFGNALTLNNPQPSEPPNTATAWAERPIDDDVLNLVSTDFTIQAWFNLADANGKEQALLDKLQGSGSGGGWTMTVEQQAGAVQFYSSSGAFVSTSLPKISTGVWHQFIVRSDSSGVDFIFDGVTLVENLELPAIQAFSEELHIGRRTDGSPPAVPGDPRNIGLNGRIDDVAIWQRSLTANDIQALWNDGFGRPVIAVAAASGQQAAAVSTVATIPELATTSSVEIQHPSNESELVTSSIARSTFPANISLQLNTHEQPSTRLSFNPSTERRAYRTLNDFSSYQPLETPTLPTTNRFDVAISLLALPEQESEASHESVDHAFDEFGEEELVLQPL